MPKDPMLSTQERETDTALPAYSLHLDMVRGLAAIAVLIGHAHLIVSGHTSEVKSAAGETKLFVHATGATGLGTAAVVVFFVLSGYLVGGSVLRDLSRDAFSASKYAVRRLSRLWVVFIPAIFLGFLADWISLHRFGNAPTFVHGPFSEGTHHSLSWMALIKLLSFLYMVPRMGQMTGGTNVSLWSLSNEFWYYAIFPFFAVAVLGKRLHAWARTACLLIGAFLLWFIGVSMAVYFLLWLAGVIAYVAPQTKFLRDSRAAVLFLTLQFLATLYIVRSYPLGGALSNGLIGISFTLLLYGLLHRTQRTKQGIYSNMAHVLSFPSYTLYANHVPFCILAAAVCVTYFPQLLQHERLLLAIVLALVVLYTAILYWAFENNTNAIRRFFEMRLLRRPSGRRASDSSMGNIA